MLPGFEVSFPLGSAVIENVFYIEAFYFQRASLVFCSALLGSFSGQSPVTIQDQRVWRV